MPDFSALRLANLPSIVRKSTMMLRSLPRVSQTSLLPRTVSCSPRCISPLARYSDSQKPTVQQKRHATAHAISNPTLAGIEKRWEGMPAPEQAKLWMALRDRMKTDWHDMTLMEKKAGTRFQLRDLLTPIYHNRKESDDHEWLLIRRLLQHIGSHLAHTVPEPPHLRAKDSRFSTGRRQRWDYRLFFS